MRRNMASVAILCLLLLERFLASDMDSITEPVINGLRALEQTARRYSRNILPPDLLRTRHRMTRFYLFNPEFRVEGRHIDFKDQQALRFFDPRLDTKIIIHGFLDKVKIADWMHQMKDEFLILDNFNVIVVDWSFGNSIPYSKAAANTEQVGEEISELLNIIMDEYGANPRKFHLIGHSLGSHVAGYVGERIKGLNRITGLDPATYLFSNASPRTKLDRSDAEFVDVIHTDAGGIGMVEPVGHVDFYPNGGAIQTGCTASNSLRALLEHGVVEGVRNIICSHMRAPLLFTATINAPRCQMIGYKCPNYESFSRGECDSCGEWEDDCAPMGYHMDTTRDYGDASKYYLLTSDSLPFCGYEYKISLERWIESKMPETGNQSSLWRSNEWSSSDILHISLYGSSGNAEFSIEGKVNGEWQENHVVLSRTFLGDVLGAIIRWSQKPLSRVKHVMDVVSKVILADRERPSIRSLHVSPLKTHTSWRIAPIVFELCVSPVLTGMKNQQGATFRNEYC